MTTLHQELTRYIASCFTVNEGEELNAFDTDTVYGIVSPYEQVPADFRNRLEDYLDECWDSEHAPDAQGIMDLLD